MADRAIGTRFLDEPAIAQHSIDTSILRTSKQIHREGYDVMVKTNRFVRVTTSEGIPLRFILNHLRVPVVSDDVGRTRQFQGYVLAIALTSRKEIGDRFKGTFSTAPCSLMLLSRDMDDFCSVLVDGDVHIPDFGAKVAMLFTMAPNLPERPTSHKNPMSQFFSEKTQEVILRPFRTHLRGFKTVKVGGLVSRAIAAAVEDEMAQNRSSDPEMVIVQFQSAKDEGQLLYRSNRGDEGCLKWQDAALEIEQLRQGSSWKALAEKGGVPFVARLAEIYFLMKLNIAHIKITGMAKGELYSDLMAEDALTCAIQSLTNNYWMPDFQWRPSTVHKAKLRYRHAIFLRLQGDPQTVRTAVTSIEVAYRMLPDDAGIVRERAAILAWKNSLM